MFTSDLGYMIRIQKRSQLVPMENSGTAGLPEVAIPERPYLREEVYLRLKRYVADVAANSSAEVPLREADLTRILGVSRTPIREALNRLHQEGLVAVLPRRGFRIKPSSTEEYLSWLEIRETLDGIAARSAAQRISPKSIAELRALFKPFTKKKLQSSTHLPSFSDANAQFHGRICEESGNSVLIRLYSTYHFVDAARRQVVNRPGLLLRSSEEHHAIIDALEVRDSDLAERLAREHVRSLRESVQASLREPGSD